MVTRKTQTLWWALYLAMGALALWWMTKAAGCLS
jgi:hypothetical protein